MLDFQGGSRQAFQTLFELYRAPLYGFFYRRLGNRERAEDLTQDTFIAVIRAVERYEPLASVRTYFYSIASNILLSERRRQSRQRGAPEGDSEAEAPVEPRQDHDPDDVLWVRGALERLEPLEREILMLREYEQLSYEEIGDVLVLPVNTVRSRLFRAREALRSQLQPDRHALGREASEMEHI